MNTAENTEVSTGAEGMPILGFEEASNEDLIIPRVKVVNAMSPERIDGIANEGDIIISLTQENIAGKRFIPVKVYYSNIEWAQDRNADSAIICRSFDGKVGQCESGVRVCEQCKRNKFDNTKQGAAAKPLCTSYLNFLGFIEDSPMPIVLSFSKTNYNEGKKLLSLAKSMRKALWAYSYRLESKQLSKDKAKWYVISTAMAGATSPEEQALAFEIFKSYEKSIINSDYENDVVVSSNSYDEVTASEV